MTTPLLAYVAGTKQAVPTWADLVRLLTTLTGRPPTPEEIAAARTLYER